MKKHLLVGAAILGALGLAGNANAISFSDVTIGTYSDDPSDSGFAPMLFANEVANTADTTVGDDRDDGAATVTFKPSTGTWPSGNVLFDVTISGAGFDGAMTGAAFDFSDCTNGTITAPLPNANVSTGGADNATTVTFVVSNLNTCEPTESPTITVPFDLAMSGDFAITIGVRTEGGVPVDGGPRSFTALTLADAFRGVVLAAGGDHVADVNATPAYTDFDPSGLGQTLGNVQLFADTDIYVSLPASATASAADFVTASVATTGNFAAFQGTGDVDVDGFSATVVGNVATVGYTVAGGGGNDLIGDIITAASTPLVAGYDINVTADGTSPIQASTYSTSVSYTLAAGFSAQSANSAAIDTISRNGTSETLPWTASATQAAGTGSTTFVRISNPTSTGMGAVSARVASSTNAATVGNSGILAASLPAGSEQLFTSADLEAILGNFGRGDIEISVEGSGAYITRLLQRPDGTLEINNRQ